VPPWAGRARFCPLSHNLGPSRFGPHDAQVAGTISANNNGVGTMGLTPGQKIYALQVGRARVAEQEHGAMGTWRDAWWWGGCMVPRPA
jgi:hypothetical protein